MSQSEIANQGLTEIAPRALPKMRDIKEKLQLFVSLSLTVAALGFVAAAVFGVLS